MKYIYLLIVLITLLSCNVKQENLFLKSEVERLQKRVTELEKELKTQEAIANPPLERFAFIALKLRLCTSWSGGDLKCKNWNYEVNSSNIFKVPQYLNEDEKYRLMDQHWENIKELRKYSYRAEVLDRKVYIFPTYAGASQKKDYLMKDKSRNLLPK
ncbi:hypothetical protein SLH46_06305 [Draconibacterium sp. IB214405]|uniref:hypothetical protein n=1 Tax=Draconibacterium sp. IB214405 TaxID=3097352 RepID=UPI002A1689F3|nr:hypothetical protein [Draconibacterium sp. IB214405]MDX8338784.1 hypothetical protein [Draconibacterium sp. IB214405]